MKYLGILLLLLITGCSVQPSKVDVPQPLVPLMGINHEDPWQVWHDHSMFTTCVGTTIQTCAFHLCAPHEYFERGSQVKKLVGQRRGERFTHKYYLLRCQNVSNDVKQQLDKFFQRKSGRVSNDNK